MTFNFPGKTTMNHLLVSMTSVLVLSLCAACAGDPAEDGAQGGDVYDPDTPYRQGFARVNRAPFVTQIGSGALINVWVSAQSANEYARVLLDGEGSEVSLPVGTVIVREVLDDNGEIETLTLMIKGEPGYYPQGGDWWYGVADPDGTIRTADNGALFMGRLDACGSCHASRPNDDFLFGVPSDYH